jgi:CPA2 family monovalent cation:H+ antiporter-2
MFDLAVVAVIAGISALVCRQLQLSAVVGYLIAGVIVGPYTPPFEFVRDAERVRMLADLGLVFLIFGIGLGFNLRRMKRLGLPLVLAAAMAAILVLLLSRLAGAVIGLTDQQSLFVAAVLMVSSSAIIAKVLEETGANHTRWGQLALGVTLLEDIVAIVMLTLLASLTNIGQGGSTGLWELVSSFTGFVALLAVAAMLLVPWLLRHLQASASTEIRMLLVTGILLLLGWVAMRLGYSMALTAFILGAIIGSTPQRHDVDRLFEGMRHLFGAVFFVAMGMLFNVTLLGEFWSAMLALTGAAILLRMVAASAALLLVGNPLRESLRAGLTLTPLGEFSFIIALLGVQSGTMATNFYPAAVGASLLTCVISPWLIRRAEPLSESVEGLLPARVADGLTAYREWLEKLQQAREGSFAWKLIAPRVVQTIILLLIVTGGLALAGPAYRLVKQVVGPNFIFPEGTRILFAVGVGVALLPPLVALWRNIGAVSLLAAEFLVGAQRSPMAVGLVQRAVASAAILFAALWLGVLIPADVMPVPLMVAILAILLLTTALLWRNLIRWHSRIEARLKAELIVASMDSTDSNREWSIAELEREAEWKLAVREHVIPSNFLHAGKQILELNLRPEYSCSIVGIDRQGFAINNPSARERLFPGDRLLLLGTAPDLERAIQFLEQTVDEPEWAEQFDDLGTESVVVPPGSPVEGQTLKDLDLLNRHGIQIGGIQRRAAEIVQPRANESLQAGDRLLVLGSHRAIRCFADSLQPEIIPPAG